MRRKSRKVQSRRKKTKKPQSNEKNSFIKSLIFRYLSSFPLKFIKNAVIAMVIFIIVIIISQLDFFLDQNIADYIYKISSEGIDITDLNLEVEQVVDLFE